MYYDSLIDMEKKSILEIEELLKKKKLSDYINYFSKMTEQNNIYTVLENWIIDIGYFEKNMPTFVFLRFLFIFTLLSKKINIFLY